MKRCVRYLLPMIVLCAGLLSASPGQADEKAAAVRMVQDAISFLQANGLEKALDVLNDPKGRFSKGELYVFVYDLAGYMLSNSAKPALIGQNVMDVPDSVGKLFRREIIDRARKEGSGWVDYKTLNPKTKLIEEKTSYFEKSGVLVLACGIYKR